MDKISKSRNTLEEINILLSKVDKKGALRKVPLARAFTRKEYAISLRSEASRAMQSVLQTL